MLSEVLQVWQWEIGRLICSEPPLRADEDDVDTLDDDDDDAGTSDDAGTTPKPRQRVSAGGRGAIAAAGEARMAHQQGWLEMGAPVL